MSAWFAAIYLAVAAMAGGIAAIAGAGVDSLLTPLLSLQMDIRLAVVALTGPHLLFNALRCWTVRAYIDWKTFRRFGVTSAVGSLGGSLLHPVASSGWIAGIFAALLILAGLFGVSGAAERVRFRRRGAYVGGVLSGFFGGLTGEQGGLRAAALLGFECSKEAFVATATAAAVVVDTVRVPVYLATHWNDVPKVVVPALLGMAGIVAGTMLGSRLLGRVPEGKFSRLVSAVLLLIGALMILRLFVNE